MSGTSPIQERPTNYEALVKKYEKKQRDGEEALMKKLGLSSPEELLKHAKEAIKTRDERLQGPERKVVPLDVIRNPTSKEVISQIEVLQHEKLISVTKDKMAGATPLKGRVTSSNDTAPSA